MLTTDIKVEVYTRPVYMTLHAIVFCAAIKPDLCLPANNVDSTSTHTPQKYPRHRLSRPRLQHTLPQKYPRHRLARPGLQLQHSDTKENSQQICYATSGMTERVPPCYQIDGSRIPLYG